MVAEVKQNDPVEVTQRWLERMVIALNLCPFAKREHQSKRIRFKESSVSTEQSLLQDLMIEFALLTRTPEIETTVLILPNVLADFTEYNQFLSFVDDLLVEMDLDGMFQVASFHPRYKFADSGANDVENYTNRAPYPLLHILREASLAKAIERHPDTAQIPDDNIRTMQTIGIAGITRLLDSCYSRPEDVE